MEGGHHAGLADVALGDILDALDELQGTVDEVHDFVGIGMCDVQLEGPRALLEDLIVVLNDFAIKLTALLKALTLGTGISRTR